MNPLPHFEQQWDGDGSSDEALAEVHWNDCSTKKMGGEVEDRCMYGIWEVCSALSISPRPN